VLVLCEEYLQVHEFCKYDREMCVGREDPVWTWIAEVCFRLFGPGSFFFNEKAQVCQISLIKRSLGQVLVGL
jgi:hypothetical protein